MKVNVLGVKINDVNMDQAIETVEGWLNGTGKHYVVTPNPEMLISAQKDSVFKKILKMADLSIPDGVGLKLSGKVKNTVYGTDLMERLVALSAENGFTVGLLGGQKGVAEKCAECLKKEYPGLKIAFAESGGEVNKSGKLLRSLESLKSLNADILFIAFGHGKQEKWIAENLGKIPVKVAMGVGGAFDYLSGNVPRAPKIIRKIGFEWLFRLAVQPWRIKRQFVLLKYLWLLTKNK